MNTRTRRIAAILGALAILAVLAVPVIEAQTDYRFSFPFGIRTTNTGASLFVRQDGSGSLATFRDGATDEFTIDQSSSTTINPVIINGSSDAYQLQIKAAATQSTPPFAVLNSSGTPVASIDNAGGLTLPTGDVSAGEIANVVRYIDIPLRTWVDCQTDAGADMSFGTGADALADFINSATDGTGFTIQFDDSGGAEDQGSEICSQITIPADYASGGTVIARALKDAHTASNTELLTCGASINGAALGAAGTVAITAAATAAYTCTPAGTFAAGDSASLYLSITSGGTMDDTVELASIVFAYTATQ